MADGCDLKSNEKSFVLGFFGCNPLKWQNQFAAN